jgi:trans-aconitate methyltransferase
VAAQRWDPERYGTEARFVSDLGRPVLDLLDPQPGERVLDVGCGDGRLTAEIAARGASVVGVDSDMAMVAAAQRRGLAVECADAVALTYRGVFDAVFSNAALHWMLDQDDVLSGVRRALKPGGRFVAEFGGHGNIAAIHVALLAVLDRYGADTSDGLPKFFPSAAAYQARLERHGFIVDRIELIPRPTPLPDGMGAWLDIFAVYAFARIPADRRARARQDVIDLLRPVLRDEHGHWTADYVRLRVKARAA